MSKKVLFISSTGGHFSELMTLKSVMQMYDYHLVTEKTASTESLKKEYGNKIDFLIYGTREHKAIYPFKFMLNFFKSLYIFLKTNPKVIVTTGTHTAVPMCIISKIFRRKVIFIETYANVYTPTSTGKFIYKYNIATKFIVQHEELLKVYPNAICLGGVF